jgi:hypothetical protein
MLRGDRFYFRWGVFLIASRKLQVALTHIAISGITSSHQSAVIWTNDFYKKSVWDFVDGENSSIRRLTRRG